MTTWPPCRDCGDAASLHLTKNGKQHCWKTYPGHLCRCEGYQR